MSTLHRLHDDLMKMLTELSNLRTSLMPRLDAFNVNWHDSNDNWKVTNLLLQDYEEMIKGFLGSAKFFAYGAAAIAITDLIISAAMLYQTSKAVAILDEIRTELETLVDVGAAGVHFSMVDTYARLTKLKNEGGFEDDAVDGRLEKERMRLETYLDSAYDPAPLILLRRNPKLLKAAAEKFHRYFKSLGKIDVRSRTLLAISSSITASDAADILLSEGQEQEAAIEHLAETAPTDLNYITLMSMFSSGLTEALEEAATPLREALISFANSFTSNHYYNKDVFNNIVSHIYATALEETDVPMLRLYRPAILGAINSLVDAVRELFNACSGILTEHRTSTEILPDVSMNRAQLAAFRMVFFASALHFHDLCHTWRNTHYQNSWGLLTCGQRAWHAARGNDYRDTCLIYWAEEDTSTAATTDAAPGIAGPSETTPDTAPPAAT